MSGWGALDGPPMILAGILRCGGEGLIIAFGNRQGAEDTKAAYYLVFRTIPYRLQGGALQNLTWWMWNEVPRKCSERRRQLSREEGLEIAALTHQPVTLGPDHLSGGCDGTDYLVHLFYNPQTAACFRWWSHVPVGWEGLEAIVSALKSYAGEDLARIGLM
jgi:hypothetical protein